MQLEIVMMLYKVTEPQRSRGHESAKIVLHSLSHPVQRQKF